jgi:lipopolysaccharide biosynthesis glycosyltransferase
MPAISRREPIISFICYTLYHRHFSRLQYWQQHVSVRFSYDTILWPASRVEAQSVILMILLDRLELFHFSKMPLCRYCIADLIYTHHAYIVMICFDILY